MSYIFSEMKTFRLSVGVDDLVWRQLKIAYYVAIWFLYSQKNVAKSAYFTQKNVAEHLTYGTNGCIMEIIK